jgi:hypothetical protein
MAKRAGLLRASNPKKQMAIAFPKKGILEPKAHAEVVALLGQLLLQVARAHSEHEAHDDAS